MNGRGQSPEVDDGETFDFIADFSLLSMDQQRVVSFGRLDDDALDATNREWSHSAAWTTTLSTQSSTGSTS
ncbi:hypothetical protein AAVH_32450, partial [Aphelenchoides avenae]